MEKGGVEAMDPQPVPKNGVRHRQVIHDVLGDHQSLRTPESPERLRVKLMMEKSGK